METRAVDRLCREMEADGWRDGKVKGVWHKQSCPFMAVKEETVTCKEISGMGPCSAEIKQGKKERKKTDKERVK